MRWRFYREFYPKSRPRAAKGGIKSQSKRGVFGESWWARRWIAVLESFDLGGRLTRGKSYARQGQVLSIDVGKGKVQARVQGSQPKPYEVAIRVKQLSPEQWRHLVEALAQQALFVAKLLAGEMPQEIEEVFRTAKLSLFAEKHGELTTSCSCPDSSNPCKHIAAVYYLLGEEFDRDPFLLFRLRGLGREDLLAQLQDKGAAVAPAAADEPEAVASVASEPLPADAAVFWARGALPEDFFGAVQAPPVSAGWPKRLGSFPFWRGAERFLDALEPIYRAAATRGQNTFLGSPGERTLDEPPLA